MGGSLTKDEADEIKNYFLEQVLSDRYSKHFVEADFDEKEGRLFFTTPLPLGMGELARLNEFLIDRKAGFWVSSKTLPLANHDFQQPVLEIRVWSEKPERQKLACEDCAKPVESEKMEGQQLLCDDCDFNLKQEKEGDLA